MVARFFAPSRKSKRCFGLNLPPIVPTYPAPNQRLTNLCTLNARTSARACEITKIPGFETLLRETLMTYI
jgi:hypothetical protein